MASPPPDMSGPGLLYVMGRISRKDILDEATYIKWYDDDHIAEIIETSGVESAFRFIRKDREAAAYPYLALYPLEDLAFLKSEEFKKIRVHSDLLPGSGIIYDMAEFGVRYYGLKEVFDETRKGKGHTKTIVPAQFELKDGSSVQQFEAWIKDKHIPQVSQTPGYLRSTKFELIYARTNAQSRALKGLPTTDETGPEPPTWLVLHELESDDVDIGVLHGVSQEASEGGRFNFTDLPVYGIARRHGEEDFFHGR